MTAPAGRTPREGSPEVPAPLAAAVLVGGALVIGWYFMQSRQVTGLASDRSLAAGESQRNPSSPKRALHAPVVRPVQRPAGTPASRRQAIRLFESATPQVDEVWDDVIRLFPEAFGIRITDEGLEELVAPSNVSEALPEKSEEPNG